MPIERRRHIWLGLCLAAMLVGAPAAAHAYPNAEVVWTAEGGPPFSIGVTGTATGFLLASDCRLIVSFGQVLKLIDLGTFAPELTQPVALSTADNDAGIIEGIGFLSGANEVVTSQDSGNLLVFNLSDLTSKPNIITVVASDKLGPLAVDTDGRTVYVSDNTAHAIQVVDLSTGKVTSTIALAVTGSTTFSVTDAIFTTPSNEAYFTTDAGALFVLPSGGTAATLIDIGVTAVPQKLSLAAVAATPLGDAVWVVDATGSTIVKVPTATHTKGTPIALSPNAGLSDIAVAQVTNPTANYVFVGGTNGVSVVDSDSGQVFNFSTDPAVTTGPITVSAQPLRVAASSVTDGMVYLGFSTGELGVLSDRPFGAFTGVTYSAGGTTMGLHQSVTLTIMANADATYELRSGGSVDASGTVLTDATGATSGSLTADTEQDVVINYDDNAAAFLEGANDIWLFVTANSLRGRRATSVNVDTPPPEVVIRSTGFGNGRIYVNADRITVNDMATYNVYVDTDPAAVLTKTDVAVALSQPSSGDQVTATVDGLTNGTQYFIAMEAVDQGGNKSLDRTSTLPDGSAAAATPEVTGGPAVFSGEKGCALVGAGASTAWGVLLAVPVVLFIVLRRGTRRGVLGLGIAFLLLASAAAHAEETQTIQEQAVAPTGDLTKESPPWGSFEVKTGFWMPQSRGLKQFFSPCCNLVTRIQGGLLIHRRYGIELGAGVFYKSGDAIAEGSGAVSQDKFKFLLIPIDLSFAWRADYFSWRYLIPYLKAGFDGVVFRERDVGQTIKGIKFGVHGVGGVQINIAKVGDVVQDFESIGIKDFFLTLETQYQWINNFGGKGLDLSGPVFSAGFLMEF